MLFICANTTGKSVLVQIVLQVTKGQEKNGLKGIVQQELTGVESGISRKAFLSH
jgi:hypothetical protein